jgi:hypothetical protein
MAGTPAKSKALGQRVTVLMGQVKKKVKGKDTNTNVYSLMLKSTADYFGFKIEASATTKPSSGSGSKKRSPRLIRGSSGSGSIKVPAGKPATGKKQAYKRIPIPNGLTLIQIKAFLSKASKNKPTSFVSKDGRSYPISDAKGAK